MKKILSSDFRMQTLRFSRFMMSRISDNPLSRRRLIGKPSIMIRLSVTIVEALPDDDS